MKILETLNEFRFSSSSCKLEFFKGKLINPTCVVMNSDTSKPDYLLQRINAGIFGDSMLLMQNINRAMNDLYPEDEQAISPVMTKEGRICSRDSEGYYWRMYQMISRRELRKIKDNPACAYAWATAFGKLMADLDEFPAQSQAEIEMADLYTTKVLASGLSPVTSCQTESRGEIKNEIDYVFRLIKQVEVLNEILREDKRIHDAVTQVVKPQPGSSKLLDLVIKSTKIRSKKNKNYALA